MPSIEIQIPWVKAKQRPRFFRGHAYTPKETKDAEAYIADAWRLACVKERGGEITIPKPTEVSVDIGIIRALPDSRPKSVTEEADIYKPDLDNVGKLVLDGLSKGGAWADDTQVTRLYIHKAHRKRGIADLMIVIVAWEGE